jgi:hypothetical protein
MKIAVTPCVCFAELVLLKVRMGALMFVAMVVILIGVGLCTITDFHTVSSFV